MQLIQRVIAQMALLKDAAFFDWLEANAAALVARDLNAMDHAVYRCAELHLAHIAGSGACCASSSICTGWRG